MSIEIERKFLVTDSTYKQGITPLHILQGFISTGKDQIVRVRVQEDRAMLTLKNTGSGLSRNEYEYEIPLEDARELIESMCLKPTIEKFRYRVIYKGKLWEVDEFMGENKGLTIAEIELRSEDETFVKPNWLGTEVTNDPKYYNANLIEHPYTMWARK